MDVKKYFWIFTTKILLFNAVNICKYLLYQWIYINLCLDFVHYQEDSFLQSSVSFLSEKNENLVSKCIQIEKNESNVKNIRTKCKSYHRMLLFITTFVFVVCSYLSSSIANLLVFLANDESQVKFGEELLSTFQTPSVLMLPQRYEQ